MRLSLFIALRYLLSRSRMGAINWVSGISAVAIAIVTAALVCVLSVYNGYVKIILEGAHLIDAELTIEPVQGQTLSVHSITPALARSEIVASYAPVLRSEGMLRTSSRETYVEVYGIDRSYASVIPIDSSMATGDFFADSADSVRLMGQTPIVVGMTLAAEGATTHSKEDLPQIYFPRRRGMINPLAPGSAFRFVSVFASGVIKPMREDVDRRAFLPIDTLRDLLDHDSATASTVLLRLTEGTTEGTARAVLQPLLGEQYRLLNREQQQPELTLLIKTEKVMVYLIMLFILILAAFNLTSTIVMLIMEKRQDLATLEAMGATSRQQASIFAMTGLLISLIGSLIGMAIGLIFCWAQTEWGFLTSGEGFSQMPFPIDVQGLDVLLVFGATLLISSLTAILPPSTSSPETRITTASATSSLTL